MSKSVTVLTLPKCDVCRTADAAYDSKTVNGPWANLCEDDYRVHGVGKLGTGFGQRLVLRETEKK